MRGLTLEILFDMRDGLGYIKSAACWKRKTIAPLSKVTYWRFFGFGEESYNASSTLQRC